MKNFLSLMVRSPVLKCHANFVFDFSFVDFFLELFSWLFSSDYFPDFSPDFFLDFFPDFFLDFFPHFFLHLSLDFFLSLRSRRLELVGARKNGRARRRHFLARACSLFCPLLPSACYAGYFSFDIFPTFSPEFFLNLFLDFFLDVLPTFFQLLSPLITYIKGSFILRNA